MNKSTAKKVKKKATKKTQPKKGRKTGTTVKKAVLNRVTAMNKGPLQTPPQRKTKYQICAQFIKENSGKYSKAEIVSILEKEYGICKGTGSTCFCEFMNPRYKPQWLEEEMWIDGGKVYLAKKKH